MRQSGVPESRALCRDLSPPLVADARPLKLHAFVHHGQEARFHDMMSLFEHCIFFHGERGERSLVVQIIAMASLLPTLAPFVSRNLVILHHHQPRSVPSFVVHIAESSPHRHHGHPDSGQANPRGQHKL